jgi:hypothetical protein
LVLIETIVQYLNILFPTHTDCIFDIAIMAAPSVLIVNEAKERALQYHTELRDLEMRRRVELQPIMQKQMEINWSVRSGLSQARVQYLQAELRNLENNDVPLQGQHTRDCFELAGGHNLAQQQIRKNMRKLFYRDHCYMTLVVVLLALSCAYLVFSHSQVVPEPLEVNMKPQMWCEYGVKAGPFIIIKPMPQPTLFEVGWKYAESWFLPVAVDTEYAPEAIEPMPVTTPTLVTTLQSIFGVFYMCITCIAFNCFVLLCLNIRAWYGALGNWVLLRMCDGFRVILQFCA